MIVREFLIDNTQIAIDNTYYPQTEEEKQLVYDEFNRIGCEIIFKGAKTSEKTTKIQN